MLAARCRLTATGLPHANTALRSMHEAWSSRKQRQLLSPMQEAKKHGTFLAQSAHRNSIVLVPAQLQIGTVSIPENHS